MSKISVIIPVYNVEKYIERCARSLFDQTLDDIEYIFVDDCTPDNSVGVLLKVIEKYPLRKRQIHIYTMPHNSRQAKVRSYGMSVATADYVIHCDSDDWVDSDLYEKMYNEAIKSNADVVLCPIRDEYQDHGTTRPIRILPTTCKEVLKEWYHDSLGMHTWNKLVKRSVYIDNGVMPYNGINMWEDNALMFRVFYYANGLSQIKDSVYHYNQANQNAITSSFKRSDIDQMIACANKISTFFKDKPDGSDFTLSNLTLKYLAKLYLVTDRFDWLHDFYTIFPESNKAVKYIELNAFSKKGRIRFLFVKYHLAWLFVTLFKIKNFISK